MSRSRSPSACSGGGFGSAEDSSQSGRNSDSQAVAKAKAKGKAISKAKAAAASADDTDKGKGKGKGKGRSKKHERVIEWWGHCAISRIGPKLAPEGLGIACLLHKDKHGNPKTTCQKSMKYRGQSIHDPILDDVELTLQLKRWFLLGLKTPPDEDYGRTFHRDSCDARKQGPVEGEDAAEPDIPPIFNEVLAKIRW